MRGKLRFLTWISSVNRGNSRFFKKNFFAARNFIFLKIASSIDRFLVVFPKFFLFFAKNSCFRLKLNFFAVLWPKLQKNPRFSRIFMRFVIFLGFFGRFFGA